MSDNDVKINIETAVKNQKDVVALQREIVKLGMDTEEASKKFDEMESVLSDLPEAEKLIKSLQEANEELERTSDELEKTSNALNRSREDFISFSKSADPKQIKEMNKNISDQVSSLKKLQDAQEKARKKYSDVNTAIDATSDSVKKLVRDQEHYKSTAEKTTEAQAEFIKELEKMRDVGEAYQKLGVKDLEKEIEDLEGAYKTLKGSGKLSAAELRDAHQKLTEEVEKHKKALNGTDQAYKDFKKSSLQMLPVAAAFSAVSYSAIKYEEAMADVKKVITATDEQFKELSNSLLEMSKTVPVSAKGLAEIAAAGAQLGVEVENIKGFVTITADMATAFDMTAENAGKAVASLSNVLGIAINDTEALGDAINHLSNNSAASASQIVDLLTNVGGAGKAIGLTAEQTAALGSTLIAFGKSSDVASTSLNAILPRLQMLDTLGSKGQNALDKMGVSAVEMAQKIEEDAAGAIVYFLEKANELSGKDKTGVLYDIFGRGPQSDVLLMASNVETLKKQLDLVGNSSKYLGSMQKEAASRAETTANQLVLLKNNVDILGISLGSKLLPVINSTASGLIGIVEAVTEFTEAFPLISKLVVQLALLSPAIKLLSSSMKLLNTNVIAAAGSLKAFGLSIISQTRLMAPATIATNSLAASMAGLGLSMAAVTGALIALNKWMEAYGKRAEANAALTKALNDEEKIRLEYLERGIILQNDGTISIDKNTQASYKNLKAIREQETEQDKLNKILKEDAEALELVNSVLAKTGTSVEELQTNISNTSRVVVDDFNKIANSGVATSKIISYQLVEALKAVKTPEEMNLLISTFNDLSENGKMSASVFVLFNEELNKLNESFKSGAISEAEFTAQKEKLIEALNKQHSVLSQVNEELAKQIELINIQIQQDKKVTESLIKKLEAERDLAKAVGDTMRAEQLENQIKTARIGLMNREAGLIKESIALLKQELNALVARQKAGEKLTEQEKARIKALEVEIASLENEASALQTSAQAQERAAQGVDKHAKSIKDLTSSIKDATSASNELSGALDKNTKSQRRTTSSTTETKERVVRTEHALRGMADAALMSASALKELQKYQGFMDSSKYRKQHAAQDAIADQINRFQELQKEISNMDGVTYKQLEAWERMAKGFHYVNEEAVEELRRNLDSMRKEVERQHKEIEDRNKALKNQLRDMNDQDENRSRQRQQMEALAEIQAEIDKAQEEGDRKKVEMLEEQLNLTKRIQVAQNVEVEKQQREKARKEVIELNSKSETNITLNGENVGNVNLDDPKTQEKLFQAFINRLKIDQQRSTKNAAYNRANRTIR